METVERRRGQIRSHDGVAFDGHRQHETVVVIGMFADDIDTAGRGSHPARAATVNSGKFL